MLFNSFTFLGFFACVLVLHYAPLPWRLKKLNLLVASYLFYAAWNPPLVLLLWISTAVDWTAAKAIAGSDRRYVRRLGLLASLSVNLGLLGFFKYGDFLLENFVVFARHLGISYQPAEMDIILPVGISFYTFQTLSYTIDIYRGRGKPWNSFLDFALYVTFFPQLVAGPIVRATDFLPQCRAERKASGNEFGWGLNLLLIGLFQKIVIADGLLAPIVEQVYSAPGTDFLSAWTGTLAFAGQIFCDFAGYSTCAIGIAMCLGFGLPDNFRYPYAAAGFSDFWRRWHISLSSWLRDYLYIPLGGNRVSVPRAYVNLMLTMLIGGLWHGAAWTFIIWGGLHGIYLVVERLLLRRSLSQIGFVRTGVGRAGIAAITFTAVCLAWTFFRAESLSQGLTMAVSMVDMSDISHAAFVSRWEMAVTAIMIAGILAIHWRMRDTTLEESLANCPTAVWATGNALMLVAILTISGEDRAFIYFQF